MKRIVDETNNWKRYQQERERVANELISFLLTEPVDNFEKDFSRAVCPYYSIIMGNRRVETVLFENTGIGGNRGQIYLFEGDKLVFSVDIGYPENPPSCIATEFDTKEWYSKVQAINYRLNTYDFPVDCTDSINILKTLP